MKKIIVLFMLLTIVLCAQEVDYEKLHKKGRLLYQTGDPSEALEVYQEILNYFPEDVDALLYRGRLFARLKLYDLAEAELLRTIELAPEYMDAYYALASVYYWSGQLDKARSVLTTWITMDMNNPEAYLLSARIAIVGRKYAAARTFLEQALALGADPQVVEDLSFVLLSHKRNTLWEAGVNYEYLAVDQGRPDWQQAKAFITHDFGNIQISAEFSRYLRNNDIDNTIALDSYYKLWKKAYMNTRIQAGLNWEFMPRLDITTEIFQAVGTRHEPSLGYRLMYYGDLTAHIPSIAWAMYPGNWYVRDKVSMVFNGGLSWQNQFTMRYFLRDVDTYLQLMNVLGTDFLYNDWVNTISFALSASLALGDHWIMTGVTSWTRDEFNLNRLGGSLGIAYRW